MTPRLSILPRLLPFLPVLLAPTVHADTPAFDRPGIAFSTTTLPAGSFSVEQGLPDVSRDHSGGTTATSYSADTRVRIGLGSKLEMQLGTALLNRLTLKDQLGTHSTKGIGDSSIALKAALPSSASSFSWAALGAIEFATGDDAFTSGATQYSLGLTGSWALGLSQTVSLYANIDRLDGNDTFTLSPSLGFGLSDTVSAYVEAGLSAAKGSDDYLAGGGLTWMVTPRLQLDGFVDHGLTSSSTDLLAGFGISIFFD